MIKKLTLAILLAAFATPLISFAQDGSKTLFDKKDLTGRDVNTTPSVSVTPEEGAWKWLWNDSPTPGSGARLKKEFELVDASVKEAILRVDCDNGAKVFLNEQLVATNQDWQKPTIVDVSKSLRSGKNVLLAEATNKGAAAAFVASLTLKLADGTERMILTDASWSATAPGSSDWKPAKVVANYGAADAVHNRRSIV